MKVLKKETLFGPIPIPDALLRQGVWYRLYITAISVRTFYGVPSVAYFDAQLVPA